MEHFLDWSKQQSTPPPRKGFLSLTKVTWGRGEQIPVNMQAESPGDLLLCNVKNPRVYLGGIR